MSPPIRRNDRARRTSAAGIVSGRSAPRRLAGFLVLLVFSAVLASFRPGTALAEEEFNLDRNRAPEENLLSLIFGSPPPMATERGILLIDAFLDDNGNGQRDPGEEDLAGKISCRLDGIDYTVPAFIPGLKYEGSYQLACSGASFEPDLTQPDLFVGQRGEIIRIDIPCRSLAEATPPPLLKNSSAKD